MASRPTKETLERMKQAAGPGGWSVDADEIAPCLVEWRERWKGSTPLLLKPSTVASVAEIVRIAAETGTPLVPQGGNTGLAGGQIPDGEVLLSLKRLVRVRVVDAMANTIRRAGNPR